jgi:peptidoglycan/LPS O-acetylase OafA/YrhL
MQKSFDFQILNQIRGFFCVYIIFHNFTINLYHLDLVSFPVKLVASLGQEVVIGFFLMSGFLIFFSLERKYFSFKHFLIKRFHRIYTPLIVSLLVSGVIGYFTGSLSKLFTWQDLIGNLLLLQDFGSVKPGTWFYPFLGNLPLWSLSYQWWFYLLVYPLYRFLPKTEKRIYWVLGLSIFAYIVYSKFPNQVCLILIYFILEWVGIELGFIYFKYRQFTLAHTRDCLIAIAVMVIITGLPIFTWSNIKLGHYPFLIFRHFFIALIFLLISIGAFKINWQWFFKPLLSIFNPVYPISYGLYVLHYPLLVHWGLRNFHDLGQIPWQDLCLSFLTLIVLSYLAEIQLPKLINWLVEKLFDKAN